MDILLVEDEPIFRAGLRSVLGRAGFRVVGEADTARAAFELADRHAPDVVIMDLMLPGMDGVTATREMRRRLERGKVLVLSGLRSPRDVQEAFEAGASGYLVKSEAAEVVTEAVRCVAGGDRYVSDEVAAALTGWQDAPVTGPIDALSPLSTREREVFHLLVSGLPNERVARELCISQKTLGTHRYRIYSKLGCHSMAELIRFAALNDLMRDSEVSGAR